MPGKPHLQLIDGSRDKGPDESAVHAYICKGTAICTFSSSSLDFSILPLKMQLITQLHPVLCCPRMKTIACPYQCINDTSPPAAPERWQYHHLKFTDFLTPNAIFIGGFQTEPISTTIQIIIIGKTAVWHPYIANPCQNLQADKLQLRQFYYVMAGLIFL